MCIAKEVTLEKSSLPSGKRAAEVRYAVEPRCHCSRTVVDSVARGEGAVQQDEVRVALAPNLEQTWCWFGKQIDDLAGAGMGGGLADREPVGESPPGWRVRAGTSGHRRTLGWMQLASAIALVTMSRVSHSTSARGRPSAAGWMINEAPEQCC